MVSPDGWRVDPVIVQTSLARPDRPMLRVKHRPYLVADGHTVTELSQHVDLATLVPEQRV